MATLRLQGIRSAHNRTRNRGTSMTALFDEAMSAARVRTADDYEDVFVRGHENDLYRHDAYGRYRLIRQWPEEEHDEEPREKRMEQAMRTLNQSVRHIEKEDEAGYQKYMRVMKVIMRLERDEGVSVQDMEFLRSNYPEVYSLVGA